MSGEGEGESTDAVGGGWAHEPGATGLVPPRGRVAAAAGGGWRGGTFSMLPSSFLTANTIVVPKTGVSRLRSIMPKASMNGSISTSTSPGAACAASLSSMLALLLLMLLPLRWWPGPRSPLGEACPDPRCCRHARHCAISP